MIRTRLPALEHRLVAAGVGAVRRHRRLEREAGGRVGRGHAVFPHGRRGGVHAFSLGSSQTLSLNMYRDQPVGRPAGPGP